MSLVQELEDILREQGREWHSQSGRLADPMDRVRGQRRGGYSKEVRAVGRWTRRCLERAWRPGRHPRSIWKGGQWHSEHRGQHLHLPM